MVTFIPKSFWNLFAIGARAWPRSTSIQIKSSPLVHANSSNGTEQKTVRISSNFKGGTPLQIEVNTNLSASNPIGSKDAGQLLCEQFPGTMKSRFYRFWRASQGPANRSPLEPAQRFAIALLEPMVFLQRRCRDTRPPRLPG